eukprot:jgi/Picsp_1/5670/NSC_03029-R1_---NA---
MSEKRERSVRLVEGGRGAAVNSLSSITTGSSCTETEGNGYPHGIGVDSTRRVRDGVSKDIGSTKRSRAAVLGNARRVGSPSLSVVEGSGRQRTGRMGQQSNRSTPSRFRLGSGQRASDQLVENLNSALRALGGTPSKLDIGSYSPVPAMQSLDIVGSPRTPGDVSSSLIKSVAGDDERGGVLVIESPASLECGMGLLSESPSVKGMKHVMGLQEKHGKLLQKCSILEDQALQAEKRIRESDRKVEKNAREMEKMKESIRDVQNRLEELEDEESLRRDDLKELDDAIKDKESILRSLQCDVDKLRSKKMTLEIQVQEAQEDVNSLISKLEVLHATAREVEQMEKERDDIKKSILALKEEEKKIAKSMKEYQHMVEEANRSMEKSVEEMIQAEEMAESHHVRALRAKEEWETYAMKSKEVQCELVEASARLEAKREIIQDSAAAAQINQERVVQSRELEQKINEQQVLLEQLENSNRIKLEESKTLTARLAQQKQEGDGSIYNDNRQLDHALEEENRKLKLKIECHEQVVKDLELGRNDMEASLQEALKEIERLTHQHASIKTSEVLQMRLNDTEYRLENALVDLQFAQNRIKVAENGCSKHRMEIDRLEKSYQDSLACIEEKDAVLSHIKGSSALVEEEVGRCEKSIQKYAIKNADNLKLIKLLTREKTEAVERASRLQDQVDELRSCLRRQTLKQQIKKSGWQARDTTPVTNRDLRLFPFATKMSKNPKDCDPLQCELISAVHNVQKETACV